MRKLTHETPLAVPVVVVVVIGGRARVKSSIDFAIIDRVPKVNSQEAAKSAEAIKHTCV